MELTMTEDSTVPDEWVRRERAFRGISRRLAARYLHHLGGDFVDGTDADSTTELAGDGWRATLSADSVNVGRSLSISEVTVSFAGEPAVLEELIPDFAQKAMRAGG